ncbi:MAG: hypothetical protein HWD92_03605 [Flavobacteriia bacterium]|nr:hypothetical protein [Flavobacteriia bacterium]
MKQSLSLAAFIGLSFLGFAQSQSMQLDYTSFAMREFGSYFTAPEYEQSSFYGTMTQFHEIAIRFGGYRTGRDKHFDFSSIQLGVGFGSNDDPTTGGSYGFTRPYYHINRTEAIYIHAAWIPSYTGRITENSKGRWSWSLGMPIGVKHGFRLIQETEEASNTQVIRSRENGTPRHNYQLNLQLEPGVRYAWNVSREKELFVQLTYPFGANYNMSDEEQEPWYWTGFVPYGRLSLGIAF